MRPDRLVSAVIALAAVVLPHATASQQTRPRFGSQVEVARIQVSVVDDGGSFLSGLGPEDFEVYVAGEPRQLVDVLQVTVPDGAASEFEGGDTPGSATPVEPPRNGVAVEPAVAADARTAERRHFVLFLDLSAINRNSIRFARRIMTDFVEHTALPEDRIGLAVYSPFRGLQWAVPTTSRHELVREAIEAIGVSAAAQRIDDPFGGLPEGVRAGLSLDGFAVGDLYNDLIALEAEDMIAAVAQVGDDLAVLEARKHMILVSRGFGDDLYADPGFVQAMERELARIRANDVVVHTLFPDRLPGPDTGGSALGNRSFLYQVAEETGGTSTWYQHNATRGLDEVDAATRSYYVLTIPVRSDDPNRLPLDVRLLRPGAEVRWAPVEVRSPSAIVEMTEMQRQIQVAAALDPGFDPELMSFDLRLLPLGLVDGGGRFAAILQMEPDELERLAQARGDGSLQFDLLGIAMEPGGTVTDVFQSQIEANDRARDAIAVGPLRYIGVFTAPPGRGVFKLLLREQQLGKLSARSGGFVVPDEPGQELWATDPLRVLRPAMADVARSTRVTDDNYPLTVTGRRLVPDLDPLIRAGSSNRVLVLLANLGRHPFTGEHQLLAAAQLTFPDLDPFDLDWVRVVGLEPAAEAGMVRALIEVELPPLLPSGQATLRLTLADAITGTRTTVAMPLGVLAQ